MARALGYIIVLAVIVAAAVWLADHPGRLTLDWFGYEIEVSLALAAMALAVVIAVLLGLYRFVLAFARTPRRFGRFRAERRRRSGYLALTRGMVAVAAGDVDEATHQARRAEALLGDPPLTMLLSAQASQLAGDGTAAESFFRSMLERRETEFLGLRGLLTQAIRRGDAAEALRLAERANRIEPKSEWVAESLFDLELRSGRWAEAEATVDRAQRKRAMAAETGRRRKAVLLHQRALDLEADGKAAEALKLARKAVTLAPDLISAVVQQARLLVLEGKFGKAMAEIRTAWAREPHPGLLESWWAAARLADPLARASSAASLAALNPDHPESRLAAAGAALEAQLWGEARRYLAPLAETAPTARVCRMMAELEDGEKRDLKAAHDWLLRASMVEPDPAWVCRRCGQASVRWSAVCPRCDSFDSLHWQAPLRPQEIRSGKAPAEIAGSAQQEPSDVAP